MRFALRSLLQRADTEKSVRIPLTNPWHAVAIRSSQLRCPAATQLGKRRFLSGEAPSLPLPDCACSEQCRCLYQHFDDRRTLTRRATDEGRPAPAYRGADRRRAPGRRQTDLP